jgi:hypothetical protein
VLLNVSINFTHSVVIYPNYVRSLNNGEYPVENPV